MQFPLWWDMSIILVFSTLPVTEVDGVSLNITDTHHGRSQSSAHLHEDLGILIMCHGLHNGLSTSLWIGRFKDATSNKDTVHAQLHHEGRISGGGNTTGSEVDHRKASVVGNKLHKLIWCLEVFGGNVKLILCHARQTFNVALDSTRVTHSLNNVTGASLSLGSKHSRSFCAPPQSLTNITASAHEWDIELILINVINLICHGQHL
mmetsp:Transcript_25194/g.46539  ORF Transcript_25194/g.46539 Transcript_25194/m.46539 type:complete len:206 (+) Transcript_25194:218-835(+)